MKAGDDVRDQGGMWFTVQKVGPDHGKLTAITVRNARGDTYCVEAMYLTNGREICGRYMATTELRPCALPLGHKGAHDDGRKLVLSISEDPTAPSKPVEFMRVMCSNQLAFGKAERCIYCDEPTRKSSVSIDGDSAHAKCHKREMSR